MAQIPLQVASRSLDVGNAVQYPQGGEIGRAMQEAGSEFTAVAERMQERQNQKDRFARIQTEDAMNADLQNRAQDMARQAPADGTGLHASIVGVTDGDRVVKPGLFDDVVKQYRQQVPKSQLAQFDASLPALRLQLSGRAASAQYGIEQDYYKAETSKIKAGLLNNILTMDPHDLVSFDQFKAKGRAAIEAAPLSALDKKIQLDSWDGDAAETLYQALIAKDPSAAAKGASLLGMETAGGGSAGLLRKFEGFRAEPYWDVNAWRVGYGSDTITRPDGSVVSVTPGMKVSRADAERDLQRRLSTEFEPAARNKVGAQAWDALPASTKAALASVTYNYGSLPDSVAAAAKTGNIEAIASSVENLGSNKDRRAQEAAIIRGGKMDATMATIFSTIPPDRRLALAKQAEVQSNRNAAEFENGMQDYLSFLRAGNQRDYGRENQVANYLPPDRSVGMRAQIEEAASYGADRNTLAFASPAEVASIMTKRADIAASSPDGFRQHVQDVSGLQSMLAARNEAIKSDPAGYVLKQPSIQAAYTSATKANTPQAYQSYATATLAEQARLGVPENMQRILPAQQAAAIIAHFNDQKAGSQNAANEMVALEQQYGKYWPQVFGELAATKQLSGTALVVGSMNRPDQAKAREDLAAASQTGTTALEKLLTPENKKTVSEKVDTNLAPFAATLANNGVSGTQTYLAFREATYQLALQYARSEDPGRAAERAFTDVISRAYTLEGTYRVPIDQDAGTISNSASAIISGFDGSGVMLPASPYTEDMTRSAYARQIQANGFWVTSSDESGLTLYDETGAAVRRTDGTPVSYTWAQLRAVPNVEPAAQPTSPQPITPSVGSPVSGLKPPGLDNVGNAPADDQWGNFFRIPSRDEVSRAMRLEVGK